MTGRTVSTLRTIFPERGIHVALSFWLLLALALLSAPPELTAAVLLAAALHECGHLLALAMLGAPVEGLRLSAMGAEIDARTERLSYARELAAVLAGPAVNLTCAPVFARLALRLAWDWGWMFAGAHALLGVYNLLPIPPLDGARAFYLLLSWHMGPDTGVRCSFWQRWDCCRARCGNLLLRKPPRACKIHAWINDWKEFCPACRSPPVMSAENITRS